LFYVGSGGSKGLESEPAMPLAPLVESKDKGILVDLLKAMPKNTRTGSLPGTFPLCEGYGKCGEGQGRHADASHSSKKMPTSFLRK